VVGKVVESGSLTTFSCILEQRHAPKVSRFLPTSKAVRPSPQTAKAARRKTPVLPGFVKSCETMQLPEVVLTEFEFPLVFNGIAYILAKAGDAGRIISAKKCLITQLESS